MKSLASTGFSSIAKDSIIPVIKVHLGGDSVVITFFKPLYL